MASAYEDTLKWLSLLDYEFDFQGCAGECKGQTGVTMGPLMTVFLEAQMELGTQEDMRNVLSGMAKSRWDSKYTEYNAS